MVFYWGIKISSIMTSIENFREILEKENIQVPEESLEVFRDLVDMQADLILDRWLHWLLRLRCFSLFASP